MSADNFNLSLVSEGAIMNTVTSVPSRGDMNGREDVKA